MLVTTLLDAEIYSAEELGRLYFRRWSVEIFYRDIKQTMGMDILRCKSPEMIDKELLMHAIAYNLIRALMANIAARYQIDIGRLSFKGTLKVACANGVRSLKRIEEAFASAANGSICFIRPSRMIR